MLNSKKSKIIQKLLENKSNEFKRKYYLLSYLSKTQVRESDSLMSEALSYVNTLHNTNGKFPTEEGIKDFLKETLKEDRSKNKKLKFVFEINDLLNRRREDSIDKLFEEEINKIITPINEKVNNKLKEILIESIEKNKSILLSEAGDERKTFDASDFLDSYIDDKKIAVPGSKEALDAFEKNAAESAEDLEYEEEEVSSSDNKSLNKQSAEVLLRYDWLLKKSQIPFIRKKLKFYLPVNEPRIGPNLEKIPVIDKLAIIARYKLIVEQNATTAAMRKWEIIHQIKFYLNSQQKFMDAEIVAVGQRNLRGDKKLKFTSSPSGLDHDEKRAVRSELDKILVKVDKSNMGSLNTDAIKEDELTKLLFKAAGSQRDNAQSFLEYLNLEYPIGGKKPAEQEVMSDEEYQQYLLDTEEYEEKIRREEEEEYANSPIDPETGEPLYTSVKKSAELSRLKSQKVDPKDIKVVDMQMSDALKILKQNNLDLTIVDKLTKISQKKALSPAAEKALEQALDRLSQARTMHINILPDKTKGEIHTELLDAIDQIESVNDIDSESGRVISKKWEEFIENNINTEEPMSHADIAKVSQGAYSNTGGVRQDITKQWFKSMFYATDNEMKAKIYSELGKKYIDAIRRMDLIEDSVVGIEGMRSASKEEKDTFKKMEAVVTDPTAIESYLTEYHDEEDEDTQYLDELLGGLSSFRVFATDYMKDFYANNIWNKIEADLAFAVKEYFAANHPSARIGENLTKGKQSKHVKPEFGKSIFNFIIYWTMGRTGIKDKGSILPNPKLELEQRKDYFLKKADSVINDFNKGPQQNKITNFNAQKLMDDCLNIRSGGKQPIIGKVWAESSVMSSKDFSEFLEYIRNKKDKDFELKFIESAFKTEYYQSLLDNPLKPLGNPAEIDAIRKGKGSDSTTDKGKPASFKGAPYWFKLWKEKTKDARSDMLSKSSQAAEDREQALASRKDYSFLEDDNLDLTGWQVIYKGKTAEVKDSVDIDSGKIEIIIDIFNAQGDVIDGEEKEVSIDDVFPAPQVN